MRPTRLLAAMTLAVDDPLVERSAPGIAPNAFRIWAAGENRCDDGPVFFTQASADALMAEQEARGRVYSSDFDHLSLLPDRPAEAGRASGWHRLAVRPDAEGHPELWAEDIEWCEDAKSGLEEQPPRWRFFSPAFLLNDSSEVTSYVNFALCINPLTHGLPSLASETPKKETTMLTKEEAAKHLKTLADIGAGEDERKQALAALSEFIDEAPEPSDEEGKDKPEPGEGGETDKTEKESEKPKDDEKQSSEKGDDEKVETKAAIAMASALAASTKRIERLEIDAMLRERADLPESIRTWCATQPATTVKSFLANSPKLAATRGAKTTRGEDAGRPPGLQGAELEELNRGMGIRSATEKQFEHLPTGELVTHNVGPTRAREMRTRTAGAGGNGK